MTGFDRKYGLSIRVITVSVGVNLLKTISATKTARATLSPIQLADLQLAFA